MRGYVYEFSDCLDDINSMDESDFEPLAGHEAGWFENATNPISVSTCIDHMLYYLLGSRMDELMTIPMPDGDGVRAFVMTDDIKRDYFKTRYEEMKRLVSKITLDEFALDDPYTLRFTIANTYGNAAYYNGIFYPLDSFVRNAQSGKTYYVGNTLVMMH